MSSPNNAYYRVAHKSEQPTAGCIAIFHEYCCYIKHGGIITNLTKWNPWGYVTDMSMRLYGAWVKYIMFYVQKRMTPSPVCSGSPLVRDKLLGAPTFVRLVYYMTFANTSSLAHNEGQCVTHQSLAPFQIPRHIDYVDDKINITFNEFCNFILNMFDCQKIVFNTFENPQHVLVFSCGSQAPGPLMTGIVKQPNFHC